MGTFVEVPHPYIYENIGLLYDLEYTPLIACLVWARESLGLILEWAKVDKWLLANRDLDHPFLLCECWWCVSLDN